MDTEKEKSPIIVYGAPRSGTTYLRQLLSQHPKVFISNETRVFVWLHESLNVLTKEFHALYSERQRFVEHLREAYPELIRDFYRTLAPRARYWGDKNPHYAAPHNQGCLETIATLFPGTRFIHIVRDGRDVVSSNMLRGWINFENSHSEWIGHVDIGSAFGASLPPSQYFELRYEDLVQDDVGFAHQLFDFLGIEMRPKVVEFCEAQQEKRTPLSGPTRDLGSDVASSAWERLLAPDQRLCSLELLGEHLVRYGYESEASLAKAKRELEQLSEQTSIHPIRKVVRDTLPSSAIVLIASNKDDGDMPLILDDHRRGWHFPRTNHGRHADSFADGEEAIGHLEELRAKGADYLLFPNTAFWWLEHYKDFRQYLEDRYPVIVRQEGTCRIFALNNTRTCSATWVRHS
jgi:hypothetical protein